MNFDNDENALEFINRLLEQLHQADYINQGSKIEVVYVASGGQHVETQIIIGGKLPGTTKETKAVHPVLPPLLCTDQAMTLWKKAQDAGYVDTHYQPLISRTLSAILAYEMAKRLSIREKWKIFGELWNRTKMYKDYYQALEQKQSLVFQDKLKLLFD